MQQRNSETRVYSFSFLYSTQPANSNQEEEEELNDKKNAHAAVPLASARPHPENQKENQAGHSSERAVEGQEMNKGPATLQQCADRPVFVRLACGGGARGWLRCVPLLFF